MTWEVGMEVAVIRDNKIERRGTVMELRRRQGKVVSVVLGSGLVFKDDGRERNGNTWHPRHIEFWTEDHTRRVRVSQLVRDILRTPAAILARIDVDKLAAFMDEIDRVEE